MNAEEYVNMVCVKFMLCSPKGNLSFATQVWWTTTPCSNKVIPASNCNKSVWIHQSLNSESEQRKSGRQIWWESRKSRRHFRKRQTNHVFGSTASDLVRSWTLGEAHLQRGEASSTPSQSFLQAPIHSQALNSTQSRSGKKQQPRKQVLFWAHLGLSSAPTQSREATTHRDV